MPFLKPSSYYGNYDYPHHHPPPPPHHHPHASHHGYAATAATMDAATAWHAATAYASGNPLGHFYRD
jgi:hypothetical protein